MTVLPEMLREIHPTNDLRSVWKLVRLIRSYRPDLVTSHSSKAGIISRVAAKIAGVPCVYTAHGWSFSPNDPLLRKRFYQAIEFGMSPLASKIICVSDDSLRQGAATGISEQRMTAIHNGIPDMAPSLRAKPNAPDPGQPVRLINVARFAPQKNQAMLIRAVKHVPGVHLDLIGSGPSERAAHQLVAELGIGDRVTFLGDRQNVAGELSRSHVFVLCSYSEGFPLSTLEAMRAGLPVVISNVGGAPEAVVDGETGFVIHGNTVEEWVEALNRLAADADLRQRFGEAGRALYERLFTFDRMYHRVESVYRVAAYPRVVKEHGAVEVMQ